ncbi:MAG TPA: hypothetical protein VGT08_19880 [Terracidiphilus sp.]|nr:hypothetical protein [Terracidiphilus sp.]
MINARLLRRVLAVLGWILYCLGWIRIIHITPGREPVSFLMFLISAVLILYVISRSWIAHNRHLAARGKRGNITGYTPPSYSQDYLGRELVFGLQVTSAREVTVSIIDDSKIYTAVSHADVHPDGVKVYVTPARKT